MTENKPMTVGELREKLKEFSPHTYVRVETMLYLTPDHFDISGVVTSHRKNGDAIIKLYIMEKIND
jgi:hypothetical protein